MKKILMRSAMPFGEERTVEEVLTRNLVGNNTGNLLFQNSIARIIYSEDIEITTINTTREFTDEQVDYFNSEYDMFVLPLANAFRVSFVKQLEILTSFIQRLKIPCVVIGLGIQRNLDATQWDYVYDEPAKAFVNAVLEKSSTLGLRGEITAEYLKHKGYTEGKHFDVIGCPSLYTYGDSLPVPKATNLTPQSNVTVNFKAMLPRQLYTFIREQAEQFDNYTFVSQVIQEMRTMYIGRPYPESELNRGVPENYPIHFSHELMMQDRMIGVLDDYTWFEYLSHSDFNFGSRIHGNIASILAGTPCYIFAGDQRVKELTEYHNIPHMEMTEITDKTNIFDLYEKTDYSCLLKGHKDRVTHYLNFLDENRVPHLDREIINQRGATRFDKMQASREHIGLLHPFSSLAPDEQQIRLESYLGYLDMYANGRVDQVRDTFRAYRKETTEKIKEYRKKEKKLAKVEKELAELKSCRFYKMKVKYDAIKKKFR